MTTFKGPLQPAAFWVSDSSGTPNVRVLHKAGCFMATLGKGTFPCTVRAWQGAASPLFAAVRC